MLMPTRVSAWKPTSMLGLLMEPLLVSMQMREPVLSFKRAPKSTQEPSLRLLHRLPPRLRRQHHCRYRHPRCMQSRAVLQLASSTSRWQPHMRLPLFLHPLGYEQLGL